MKSYTSEAKSTAKFFLLRCLCCLLDESRMISTQTEIHNKPEMVAVYGTSYTIPPRNCNSNIITIFKQECVTVVVRDRIT
jgi:hypothetical protein